MIFITHLMKGLKQKQYCQLFQRPLIKFGTKDLRQYGFPVDLLSLLIDFLSKGKRKVVLNCQAGVPQWSSLNT